MKLFRSVFFVPGDSDKKVAKADESIAADAIVFDLEDSVLPTRKAYARGLVAELLNDQKTRNVDCRYARIVRINPLDSDTALVDLAAVLRAGPDAIMLPKIRSAADVQQLGAYLEALEVREGLLRGATKILPIVTETPEAMFNHGSLVHKSERLIGMTWGGEDLSAALQATHSKDAEGNWAFTYQMARSQCLLAARAAGCAPIDGVFTDFRNADGLAQECIIARRDGFSGKLAIHPNQVDVINDAFTPTVAEVNFATAVVAEFAANPGAGVVQLDGKMLDIPHLTQAKNLLAQHAYFAAPKKANLSATTTFYNH